MDILLTGGTGQVGISLQQLGWPDGIRLHAPARSELDLGDPASVQRAVDARPWSAIISSGAYTAVDKAESEVGQAWAANALAPAILAHGAARAGIPIVHVSTDYVFAGTKDGFYREDDPVGPVGIYGASKEGGEQAVRTANPRHAIVRTAWVVSPHRANFLRTMLRLAADRDELRVVADQFGCPTFAGDLANALQNMVLRLARDETAPTGTYHFVNAGEASWADFAAAIFEASARRGGPSCRVVPITTADYPTPARRPANSRLATDRIRADFGIEPRPWQAALDEAVAVLV
ncbi:dTDP-4-dehydrorhamnose reductase [uncultured Enterovirga sp.]|uniref:dTDP-4-dehydrorhamnose reductase n=1 Tax=uncultured Enterovirga sp. TaxID=2026352 RepID=UPI0035CAAE6D